jgi:hypothetical protein
MGALETECGGDPDREEYFVSQEADKPVQVHSESGAVAFEGTPVEVASWLKATSTTPSTGFPTCVRRP